MIDLNSKWLIIILIVIILIVSKVVLSVVVMLICCYFRLIRLWNIVVFYSAVLMKLKELMKVS